jgi:hypothetical protein
VLDSDNDADPAGWDYYDYRFTVDWTGWRLLRVPFADFRPARHPVGWHAIRSVQFSADGWGHEPRPDTVLVLDDLSFGTGALAGIRTDTRRSGGDFVYRYTALLEERTGRARATRGWRPHRGGDRKTYVREGVAGWKPNASAPAPTGGIRNTDRLSNRWYGKRSAGGHVAGPIPAPGKPRRQPEASSSRK